MCGELFSSMPCSPDSDGSSPHVWGTPTTLTLSEVQALENELSGKEWGELLQRCKEAIGGEVEDFFDGSPSDTGSKQHRTKPTTRAAQKSMN
jgi:hypothetical protein